MMQNKSKADIEYMNELVDTNPRTNSNLYIVDARPKINAAANRGSCVDSFFMKKSFLYILYQL